MEYTEKVIRQSNYWYNDGLNRANFRDLSGAIVSLRRSLQYCTNNVAARNLLGLVYYGRGEVSEALVEWIISKNIRPRDNIANYYIRKIQGSSAELNRLNNNIKKYNQCLLYCKQGAEDLAFIQIKKVIVGHPTFVKAYQLLALMSIEREQYSRARQVLKKAYKLDITDPITLYYMNELTERKAAGKKGKDMPDEGVLYHAGNETIIQPTSPTLKAHANTLTVINVVLGIVIGVAVMVFLIEPTLLEREALINADAIRTYSQEIDVQEAQISALQTELESYRTISDEAELAWATVENTQSNYESLSEIESLYSQGSTSDSILANLLVQIDESVFGDVALERYNNLVDEICIPICESNYQQAVLDYEAEQYTDVITELEEVIYLMDNYNEYAAMLLLAKAYDMQDDITQATYYCEIIIGFSNSTSVVDEARELFDSINYNLSDAEAKQMEEDDLATEEDTTEEDTTEE